MKAIISDIHSNLEALQAVLADIAAQGVQEVYCLGDVVGYGPNPRECVDLVMQCKIVLLGYTALGQLPMMLPVMRLVPPSMALTEPLLVMLLPNVPLLARSMFRTAPPATVT